MNDAYERLTIGQAQTLARIIDGLSDHGFDPDGQGIHTPNLHVEPGDGTRVNWWLDGDTAFANGSMDAQGHGVWWTRRAYAPTLRRS